MTINCNRRTLKSSNKNKTTWDIKSETGKNFLMEIFKYRISKGNFLVNNKRLQMLLLLLLLALQPAVGFGLSKNTSPFFPIYHQLSPSSHSQHLKISFYFFSPSFPGSSSSSRPFQFLNEDLFRHPILLHSLQVTQPTYPLPLLSILLYFLLYSTLLVLDSSYFSIPHLHI